MYEANYSLPINGSCNIDSSESSSSEDFMKNKKSRSGKWSEEEENYSMKLIEAFFAGILSIQRGTTLRSYLSQKLCCDPMRISKKFAGSSGIGKQMYNPLTQYSEKAIEAKKILERELVELERAFYHRVDFPFVSISVTNDTRMDIPIPSGSSSSGSSSPSSLSSSSSNQYFDFTAANKKIMPTTTTTTSAATVSATAAVNLFPPKVLSNHAYSFVSKVESFLNTYKADGCRAHERPEKVEIVSPLMQKFIDMKKARLALTQLDQQLPSSTPTPTPALASAPVPTTTNTSTAAHREEGDLDASAILMDFFRLARAGCGDSDASTSSASGHAKDNNNNQQQQHTVEPHKVNMGSYKRPRPLCDDSNAFIPAEKCVKFEPI